MLRTFIQVLALTISLLSAYYLIKGVIETSINDMAKLSETHVCYNIKIAQSLCHQRSYYIVGFTLLLLSFILQLGNMLWVMRIKDFGVSKVGVITALIVSAVLLIVSIVVSNYLYKTHYHQVETILKKIG